MVGGGGEGGVVVGDGAGVVVGDGAGVVVGDGAGVVVGDGAGVGAGVDVGDGAGVGLDPQATLAAQSQYLSAGANSVPGGHAVTAPPPAPPQLIKDAHVLSHGLAVGPDVEPQ